MLDATPAIGAELLHSLRWAADYYHHPVGAVLTHALPGLLREGRAIDEPPEPAWQLTELGRAQDLARARAHAPATGARARGAARRARSTASELKAHDVAAAHARAARGQGLDRARAPPRAPRAELAQRRARAGRRARAHGRSARRARGDRGDASGATRLSRLSAARRDGQRQDRGLPAAHRSASSRPGRQTLLLVPEIGLTPQLVRRLRERFGERARRAALGRHGARALRRVAARVPRRGAARRRHALGRVRTVAVARARSSSTRSTTPRTSSRRGFRYSARDLAVVRAQRSTCPSCSAPRRRRSRRSTTRRRAATRSSSCRGASAARACRSVRVVDSEPPREPPSAVDAAGRCDRPAPRRPATRCCCS